MLSMVQVQSHVGSSRSITRHRRVCEIRVPDHHRRPQWVSFRPMCSLCMLPILVLWSDGPLWMSLRISRSATNCTLACVSTTLLVIPLWYCSERALSVLLSFGAHAREPIGPRLLKAAREGEVPEPAPAAAAHALAAATSAKYSASGAAASAPSTAAAVAGTPHIFRTPLTIIHGGTHDWMPVEASIALAEDLRALDVDAVCLLTPNSGHHLYMEQPVAFADMLTARLKPGARTRAAAAQRYFQDTSGPAFDRA